MASRYSAPVNPAALNNPHGYALRMIGYNQRVLELGAAAGDVTRALAAQNCEVTVVEYDPANEADLGTVAHSTVIGDLNDPALFDRLTGPFDVVLAGDVLEHLLDPDGVLKRAAQLLAPGGRVVVSLPNVAHADVRISLLQGRFDYRPLGLLDKTHIRFFTRKTINQLVAQAGLMIVEMHKVRVPVFHTELGVKPGSVSQAVLDQVLADPDAETYQFVFMAVRNNGDTYTAQLAEKYTALRENYDRIVEQHTKTQHMLAAIQASKTLRYTAKPRAVYHALRRTVARIR